MQGYADPSDVTAPGDRQRPAAGSFRNLVESLPVALVVHTGGRVVFANQEAIALWGAASAGDLAGRDIAELLDDGGAGAADVSAGGTTTATLCRLDGTAIMAEVTSAATTFDGMPATQTIACDVSARHQAEAALRASDARFRDLFENASDMIYTTDIEGNFKLGNRALLDTLEVTHDELLRMNIRDLLDPAELARANAMTERKLRGDKSFTKYEIVVTTPAGRRLQVELHTRLIYAGGRPVGVQGSARDVTEARRTEESLRQAQQIAHLGNWDWDILSGRLVWSDEVYRIFGLGPGQFLPTYEAFLDRVHPGDRAAVDAAVQATVAGGGPYAIHHRIIRHDDGAERVVHERGSVTYDAGGRPARMIGTVQDVTELRRAEQALRESEQHLRTIISSAPVIIFALDERGIFTLYEGAGLDRFGLEQGERVGQCIWDLEDNPPGRRERIRRAYAGEAVTEVVEWRGHTVETRYTPLIDPETGRVSRVVAVVFDITERRELEEQLRHAQKMEAVGSLAGGIAHDFNNLLAVIMGYTDAALTGVEPGSELYRDLREVRQASDRAASLVRQLLAFSRKQPLNPRVVDPGALIADMGGLLDRLVGDEVNVETRVAPGVAAVEVDPGQLEQVVMNLVVNARDAMPDGGDITIEVADVEITRHGRDVPAELSPGRYVLVRVTDTGDGMDEATRSRIWEPFFTTKPPGQGTGLGLPMVYGFVSQSGGVVEVDTAPGQGATFRIYLPAAGDHVAGAAIAASSPEWATVLLVDDEPSVRSVTAHLLQDQGYAVIEADSGEAALSAAGAAPAIDLVLTDVVMPGLSGPELVARLTKRLPRARILYMSGNAGAAEVAQEGDGRVAGFLRKPFTRSELAAAVREALDAT